MLNVGSSGPWTAWVSSLIIYSVSASLMPDRWSPCPKPGDLFLRVSIARAVPCCSQGKYIIKSSCFVCLFLFHLNYSVMSEIVVQTQPTKHFNLRVKHLKLYKKNFKSRLALHRPIPINDSLVLTIDTRGCQGTETEVNYLEHVQAVISLNSTRRGDVEMFLTSPMGTR